MVDDLCPDERRSLHYAPQNGHGPVADEEFIIFVVLDEDHVDGKGRLTINAFPSRRLVKKEASISRCCYTTSAGLQVNVVDKAVARGQTFIGLSLALAGDIRSIPCRHPVSSQECRAFCILDLVEEHGPNNRDSDDHGVINFSDKIASLLHGLKESTVGKAKENMRAALVEEFGAICSLDFPGCFNTSLAAVVETPESVD